MRISVAQLKRGLCWACFALFVIPSASQAQVYRWVDEHGKTHYSDKKENAGKATVNEVKTTPQQPTAERKDMDPSYWQEQEFELRKRQAQREREREKEARQMAQKPESLSDGKFGETDEEKCNFAKDVLNGSIRRVGGPPIDEHDRELARREVRKYCK